jgi:hypothetical protein
MTTLLTQILTPVGRLVQGDCFVPQTTDSEGKPLLIKNGPNAGQPRVEYYIAVAIPKTDQGFAAIWAQMHGFSKQSFPALFDAAGNCLNPAFAFKMTDGDSQVPNSKNAKPCDKEGFPGNWILGFSGGFAPKCYTAGGAELITNPEMLKRGYFIRIYGNLASNKSQQQPGIYLNHSMVEMVGYGEEINSGPSGDAVFGAAPAGALPAGASATPLANSAPIAQGMAPPQGGPAIALPQGGPPITSPQGGPAIAPPANVQPAPDFLNGPAPAAATPAAATPAAATPAAATPAAATPAAATPAAAEAMYLDANGNAFSESQLLAAKYTPAMIAALRHYIDDEDDIPF